MRHLPVRQRFIRGFAWLAGLLPALMLIFHASQPAQARQLSAAELKRLHGVYRVIWKNRHKARVQVRRDGTLLARAGNKVDTGRWQVRGKQLCVSFRVWTKGRFKCGAVYRRGGWYVGFFKNGKPRVKFRR